MTSRYFRAVAAFVVPALLATSASQAATDNDVTNILKEIRELKNSYEVRIKALEGQLKKLETKKQTAAKTQIPAIIIKGAMSPVSVHPTSGNTAQIAIPDVCPKPFRNTNKPTNAGFSKLISGSAPKSIVAITACTLPFITNRASPSILKAFHLNLVTIRVWNQC